MASDASSRDDVDLSEFSNGDPIRFVLGAEGHSRVALLAVNTYR